MPPRQPKAEKPVQPLDEYLEEMEQHLENNPAHADDAEGRMFDKGVKFALARVRGHIRKLIKEQAAKKK